MHILPLTLIKIPDNRQRREFLQERLIELAESIRQHGLYHPIVVAPEGDGYRLVAGERRLRAVTSLAELEVGFYCGVDRCEAGNIPCTLLSELSGLALREIELEENTIRVDLTWQERAQALSALDNLRRDQNPSHSSTDTAREVFGYAGAAVEKVRESHAISLALADPEISKAKSHSEAVKLLKKKAQREHRELLAAAIDTAKIRHTVLLGDSCELLSTLPDESFQVLLSDPPYGVSADSFGSQATQAHAYEDSPEYAFSCYRAFAESGYRVATSSAHLYAFCTIEHFPELVKIFSSAGWSVWPRPLIWSKGPSAGMLPKPEHGPRYTYETILFASKGDKPTLCVKPDVLSYPPVSEKTHAAEKPVDLYLDLLSRSAAPGDCVLDPFAGSGVIFAAANSAKLTATGIELNETHYATCKLRAQGAV